MFISACPRHFEIPWHSHNVFGRIDSQKQQCCNEVYRPWQKIKSLSAIVAVRNTTMRVLGILGPAARIAKPHIVRTVMQRGLLSLSAALSTHISWMTTENPFDKKGFSWGFESFCPCQSMRTQSREIPRSFFCYWTFPTKASYISSKPSPYRWMYRL